MSEITEAFSGRVLRLCWIGVVLSHIFCRYDAFPSALLRANSCVNQEPKYRSFWHLKGAARILAAYYPLQGPGEQSAVVEDEERGRGPYESPTCLQVVGGASLWYASRFTVGYKQAVHPLRQLLCRVFH